MAYEINVLTMALYVNDTALARTIADNHTAARLSTQVNRAGEPFLDAPRHVAPFPFRSLLVPQYLLARAAAAL